MEGLNMTLKARKLEISLDIIQNYEDNES